MKYPGTNWILTLRCRNSEQKNAKRTHTAQAHTISWTNLHLDGFSFDGPYLILNPTPRNTGCKSHAPPVENQIPSPVLESLHTRFSGNRTFRKWITVHFFVHSMVPRNPE
jgi:hypothetical protein